MVQAILGFVRQCSSERSGSVRLDGWRESGSGEGAGPRWVFLGTFYNLRYRPSHPILSHKIQDILINIPLIPE